MAKATKSKKKPIDQYDHKGKRRVNNPPVGLVTPETDKGEGSSLLLAHSSISPPPFPRSPKSYSFPIGHNKRSNRRGPSPGDDAAESKVVAGSGDPAEVSFA